MQKNEKENGEENGDNIFWKRITVGKKWGRKMFVVRRGRRTKKKKETNFAGKEKKKDNFNFFWHFKHFHFLHFKHLNIVQNADERSHFEQYYIN